MSLEDGVEGSGDGRDDPSARVTLGREDGDSGWDNKGTDADGRVKNEGEELRSDSTALHFLQSVNDRLNIDIIDVDGREDDTDSAIHQLDSPSPIDPEINYLSDSKVYTSEEEQFESYGENDGETDSYPSVPVVEDITSPVGLLQITHDNNQLPSSLQKIFLKRKDNSPSGDSTWPRSRRNRCSFPRRLSSNALASHLYNNVSGNSDLLSGDDMLAEEIVEDVYDLNGKVSQLQEQVNMLAQSQLSGNDKQVKLKQVNAALTERVLMLEEQLRDAEIRGEKRIDEEQKRAQELITRLDKEKSIEIETLHYKLRDLDNQYASYKDELPRVNAHLDKLKNDKSNLEDEYHEMQYRNKHLEEDNKSLSDRCHSLQQELDVTSKTHGDLLAELSRELEDLKGYKIEHENARIRSPSILEYPDRMKDLDKQLHVLRQENCSLKEQNEEIQAQLLNVSIQEGFRMLQAPIGISLADELHSLSRDDVMQKLHEQQEINKQLHQYIDQMLINIIDNNPGILEIKN